MRLTSFERGRPGLTSPTGIVCVVAVMVLAAIEIISPRDVTFGTASFLPIVAAWVFADRRTAVTVLALATAARVFDAAIDDIPVALAVVEAGTYLLASVLVAAVAERIA